jgi:uncharacterized protein (TIGR03435 family)
MQRTIYLNLLLVTVSCAFGQSSEPTPPAFEAASVKPDTVGADEGPGKGKEIVQPAAGSLTMRNVRLRSALKWAYSVQTNQISGPAWIDTERYFILAKTSNPVPEKQLRLMLQKLLTGRFQLAFHWETKQVPAFVLVVSNRGAKIKPSSEQGEGEGGVKFGAGNVVIATKATLSQFADSLTNPLRTIVLDETGLQGRYDFTLDLNVYQSGDIAAEDMPTLVARGLQDELGLKLESRKSPIPILVLDHAEKTPTEN